MVVGPTTTNCIPGLTPVPQGPQAQAPSMWEPIWDLSCDAGFRPLEATITTATSSVPPPPAAQFPPCMDAHAEDGFTALCVHTHMQTLESKAPVQEHTLVLQ